MTALREPPKSGSDTGAGTPDAREIRVNAVVIDPAAIRREAANHPAPNAGLAQEAAASALVIRELLLQEAARLAVEGRPGRDEKGRIETDEDARITALLEREINIPEAEEAVLRRFYDNNKSRFRSPDLCEARHILIPALRSDAEGFAAAVAKAEALIAELQIKPEAFAALAREHSACASAQSGGDLGQITEGQTTPEFETFLFNLEEGQLCPVPVCTDYGVHVLQLQRRVAGGAIPFDLVRDRIAEYLQRASWQQAVRQYIGLLAAEADINGIDIHQGQTPHAFRAARPM